MTAAISIYRGAATEVRVGGHAETVAYGPVLGGLIVNPRSAADQGLTSAETLYVDLTAPAAAHETGTTFPIQPGQAFAFPTNLASDVSVNAASSKHRFSAIIYQNPPPSPPAPQPGAFPPSGPTTLTTITTPAYLYEEYADDEDLQAFFSSFNSLADQYVEWFAGIALPVYTKPQINGALLDWVAYGLYGMRRPVLFSGSNRYIGPVDTYGPNEFPSLGVFELVGPNNVTTTSDDVFKRIMTWNFYKGDGNAFSIKWLKRRIMRFLIGVDGTAPNIDNTYAVSIEIGDHYLTIRITVGTRTVTGGSFPNAFGPNEMIALNSFETASSPPLVPTHYPLEPVLKEALESGVLQLPFQYSVAVII